MLRINCPECDTGLRVDDSKRGRLVRCPKCERKFTVPAPPVLEDEEEPEELLVVERPKQPKSYGLRDEEDAPRPMPRYNRRSEEDPDRPRIRKRGGGKRQATGFVGFLQADWNLDKIVVVISAGLWLMLTGLSIVFLPFVLGLFAFGFLMTGIGRIWAIAAAFGEDAGTGFLTILFPWYGLFGIEDRRPLFLTGVGVLYIATGIGIVAVFNAAGRF